MLDQLHKKRCANESVLKYAVSFSEALALHNRSATGYDQRLQVAKDRLAKTQNANQQQTTRLLKLQQLLMDRNGTIDELSDKLKTIEQTSYSTAKIEIKAAVNEKITLLAGAFEQEQAKSGKRLERLQELASKLKAAREDKGRQEERIEDLKSQLSARTLERDTARRTASFRLDDLNTMRDKVTQLESDAQGRSAPVYTRLTLYTLRVHLT